MFWRNITFTIRLIRSHAIIDTFAASRSIIFNQTPQQKSHIENWAVRSILNWSSIIWTEWYQAVENTQQINPRKVVVLRRGVRIPEITGLTWMMHLIFKANLRCMLADHSGSLFAVPRACGPGVASRQSQIVQSGADGLWSPSSPERRSWMASNDPWRHGSKFPGTIIGCPPATLCIIQPLLNQINKAWIFFVADNVIKVCNNGFV